LLDSTAKSRVVPLIRQGLRDTDEGIRAFALNALLLVGGDVLNDTADALIAQYRADSSPLVRRQAVEIDPAIRAEIERTLVTIRR